MTTKTQTNKPIKEKNIETLQWRDKDRETEGATQQQLTEQAPNINDMLTFDVRIYSEYQGCLSPKKYIF